MHRAVVLVSVSILSLVSTTPVKSFLGQRYALPPVGPRRFKPAVLAPFNEESLVGSGDAVGTLGPRCFQIQKPRPTDISEDCLFLNVFAPKTSLPVSAGGYGVDSPAAVLLWIHGGGWTSGTGNHYNGTFFAASQGLVVVAINYRLGTLGWFASRELEAEPGNHGSTGGMNGVLDMITAMRWVQANIHRFGGDPDRVTIAGESAGAEAVCMLLVSPLSKNLFLRAIMESGPCLGGSTGWGPHTREAALAASAAVAGNRTLAELRAVEDGYELLQSSANDNLQYKIEDSVDGYVLPGHMESATSASPAFELYAKGKLNSRELLLGGNSFDGLNTYLAIYEPNPITHMLPEFLYHYQMELLWGADKTAVEKLYHLSRYDYNTNAAYCQPTGDAGVICPSLEIARALAETGGKAFVYYFDYGPVCGDVALTSPFVFFAGSNWASHASELPWVWGHSPDCYRNASEVALTKTMQDLWGSFCRTGRPSSGALHWPPFDVARGGTMVLDLHPRMVEGHKAADCEALLGINESYWPAIKRTLPSVVFT